MFVKDFLSDQISSIPTEFIPTLSFALIFAALVLIVFLFLMCIFYINAKPKPQIQLRNDVKQENLSQEKMRHEDLPAISGRVGEFLSLNGILGIGPITKIFFNALEIIKNSTYDIRWRYNMPFFMLVGADGSGKSALIDNLNFEHLSSDESSLCGMWKLFKEAAIFEFPKIDPSEDDKSFWSFIGELFCFIRPRRPLDGIVLTVSTEMLTSENINIEKQANDIFEKLFAFQKNVNFRLPIYLIVTKTDLIKGFSEFSHLLGESSKQQIFGWSCPYSLNTAITTDVAEEIFDTLNCGIRKGLLHMEKEKPATPELRKAALFQTNFNKIKESLSVYLRAMINAHHPEDGLIIRGVYFVGKQKVIENVTSEILQPSILNADVFHQIDTTLAQSYHNNLYFVHDIFKEKIFKEHNLAFPIKINAVDLHKVEYRNKAIFAFGSIAATVGWFYGNNGIRNKIEEYSQTLGSIKTSMSTIKRLEKSLSNEEDQALINKNTIYLLQNMPIISRFDLVSIFVPQSWFSGLRLELVDLLGLIFDSVVMRAMYIDLNVNTKNIVQSYTDLSGRKKDLFNASLFSSFKQLQDFSKRISNLEKISSEYNSIRHLEDRSKVIDITSSLFNSKFQILDEMRNRSPNKKLIPPKFDIESFRPKAEKTLKSIFVAFLKDVLDVKIEKILQNIADDINRIVIASKEASVPYTPQDLAKIYSKTTLLSEILKNKNFAWIYKDHFMPTAKYMDVITELKGSNVVDSRTVEELIKTGEVEFHKFKARLSEYKTDITGNLLSENDAASDGLNTFQKEVKILLDLPFIMVSPSTNLTTTILDDKMLIWDLKRMKEVSDLIDKFYAFCATMPVGMRPQYFEMYKIIVKKCFLPTMQSMIGSAQIFDDMPMGHSRNLLEDAYKRQAINIRNASFAIPKIIKILNELQDMDNLKDIGFDSMITSHYISLLEKIDALFCLETPYSSSHAVFDGWHGEQGAKFLNMDDQANLKDYLSAQFARIRFLSKELASPIIDLLTIPDILAKIKDKKLIEKWKEIITHVDEYEAKKPGNSIAALESFISSNLSNVSADTLDTKGEIKDIANANSDFFLSKRSDVAKRLISRTDVILFDKAAAAYNELKKFFSESFENKFPFAASEDEASVTDMEKFVEMYEQKSKNLVTTLETNKEKKNVNNKAIDFIKSIDQIMPFLKAWISQTKTSDPSNAPISFNVQLRPAPDTEAFTASVLERNFTIKNVPVNDGDNGTFFNGDDVSLEFKWVESGDEQPNDKNASGNLAIEGASATFSYSGKWAMFRLIEANRLSKETELPDGVMVMFSVPIIDKANNNKEVISKMILKITPMLKAGDKASPLTWPVFPSSCPALYVTEAEPAPAATVASTPDTKQDVPNFDISV